MVIKCEYKEEEPEKDDKDKDKEGKQAEKKEDEAGGDDEEKKSKTQMFKYVRAFLPQWLKDHDENRLVYEAKMEVKMIAAAEKKVTKLSLDDDDDNKPEQKKKEKKAEWLEENNILIVSDNRCKILCVIVKGIQGEQHKVFMFNTTKREALITSSRAGNTDLEFNMNSHIRDEEMIFICQTESSGAVTAKQLSFDTEVDERKLPAISFTKPARGFVKDCWLIKSEDEDREIVMTICRSSTDEYINADCQMFQGTEVEDVFTWK